MNIVSSFTHSHVVPNLNDFFNGCFTQKAYGENKCCQMAKGPKVLYNCVLLSLSIQNSPHFTYSAYDIIHVLCYVQ